MIPVLPTQPFARLKRVPATQPAALGHEAAACGGDLRCSSLEGHTSLRRSIRRSRWTVSLGLCALLCWLWSGAPAHAVTVTKALLFEPCTIDDPSGRQQLNAECANVPVHENPDDQNSRQISLRLVRVAARDSSPRPDPLTLIAGGPGQSAAESFALLQSVFENVRKHRDIYLLDQRGTGASAALHCDVEATRSDPFLTDPEAIRSAAKQCQDKLDADSRFYTTSVAVRDLEHVRTRLGIAQWNIYAVSYGTRVALHYLRRYPDQVRSMVLDAVLPPDTVLAETLGEHAAAALQLIADRCKATAACNERFNNLHENSIALLKSLQQSSRAVSFENFNTGKIEQLQFSHAHLAVTIRMLSYSAAGAAILPQLLHEAYANNNFAPLARQASLQTGQVSNTIASGMHSAVVCAEDAPFTRSANSDNLFLGVDAIKALQASCADWPAGEIDADFRQPVLADVPTLILSGEADPVTPPSFGEQVASGLSSSRHLINPGQGHMQIALGCMPRLVARFLESADAAGLDTQCLDRISPPAFFVDANGPLP